METCRPIRPGRPTDSAAAPRALHCRHHFCLDALAALLGNGSAVEAAQMKTIESGSVAGVHFGAHDLNVEAEEAARDGQEQARSIEGLHQKGWVIVRRLFEAHPGEARGRVRDVDLGARDQALGKAVATREVDEQALYALDLLIGDLAAALGEWAPAHPE